MRLLSLMLLCLPLAACSPVTAQDQTWTVSEAPQPQTMQLQAMHLETMQLQATQLQTADVPGAAKPLVAAARQRLDALVVYDGRYVGIDYPGGDVPATMGVCTDVVIRSFRRAYDLDLQVAVHEDMKANFSVYPTNWGHTRPDKNIDHRRVPNLETYFMRAGYDVAITRQRADYRPGDIVSWRLDGNSGAGGLPHIGIVSERLSAGGTPLIIHNIGRGPEESDMLFDHQITGHFRVKH